MKFFKILTSICVLALFSSCSNEQFKGHMLTKKKVQSIQNINGNYHKQQNDQIINTVSKSKKKREKTHEKYRKSFTHIPSGKEKDGKKKKLNKSVHVVPI